MRLIAILLSLVLWTGWAAAQTAATPDYASWMPLAERVETATDRGEASTPVFEDLRSEVSVWRDRFAVAREENGPRIATLQAQLDALGPVPENGPESDDIAALRAQLTEQISALRAPVLRAEEAYTRADGIIRQIDVLIRERQTDRFLELGPSPLNPTLWAGAAEDLVLSLRRLQVEITGNLTSDVLQAEARSNAPLILLYLGLGVLLLARGRVWARKGIDLLSRDQRRGTGVWRFLLSLGLIALPLLGIFAISEAAQASGMVGPRWERILEQVPIWATILLGIRWLAERAFHPEEDQAALKLDAPERTKARRLANLLSILFVAREVLTSLTLFDGYGAATVAVLDFPVLVLSGLLLFRLGRLRNDAAMAGTAAAELPDAGQFRLRFLRLVGRAIMCAAVAGPVAAAVGYTALGAGIIYPTVETLALIGLVLVLQDFIHDLYCLLAGKDDDSEDLIPVLAGFALTLAALPVLALIWGARVADLTEIWTRLREGFQLGETRISPTDFLVVIVVFVLGYLITRLLQGAMRSTVLPKTGIDKGGQTAIVSGLGYIGIFVAAIVAITTGGLDLSSLAIVAGALSVGIGFGLQTVVSNFVSGIILLIERPISEGDWIEVGGTHGIVKGISVRSTRIETFDKYDMIIPNADLVAGTVSNYTRGNVLGRIIVPVGVAYGTDTREVERILMNIAREHDMVLMNPAPSVYFAGFGADSLDFEIRAVLRDVTSGVAVRTEMRHQIVERFAEAGIEIPFAQRDVWLRNPEALRPVLAPTTQADDPETEEPDPEPDTEVADPAEDTHGDTSSEAQG